MGRSRTNKPRVNKPRVNKPTKDQGPSLIGSVVHGAAVGGGMAVGSEMIHELFRNGDRSEERNEENRKINKCSVEAKDFQECLNNNKWDIGKCQSVLDKLNHCNREMSEKTRNE